MRFNSSAQMALDTLLGKPTTGIPTWLIHPMEHKIIDRLAGVPEGTYRQKPTETYLQMERNIGAGLIDQWLADNPLSIGTHGYEADTVRGATTGAEHVVCDGIVIDSPEAVVEHLEKVAIPKTRQDIQLS